MYDVQLTIGGKGRDMQYSPDDYIFAAVRFRIASRDACSVSGGPAAAARAAHASPARFSLTPCNIQLNIYIDVIQIFLFLLRLFGNARD